MGKRKNDNKGFTLVELIVVITILGILAAMMIPALLGYIDRAKGQQTMLNAKSVYTAAQAELSATYAKGKDWTAVGGIGDKIMETADVGADADEVIIGTKVAWSATGTDKHDMFTVAYVYYKAKDGSSVVFDVTGTNDKRWEDASKEPLPNTSASKQYLKIK